MTPTPLKALVGAALFAVLSSTPADAARQKNQNIQQDQHSIDQHAVSPQVRRNSWPTINRSSAKSRGVTAIDRNCLHHTTRSLLDRLEARFGRVDLVSACRPGARMPSGDLSLHALNRAFDFRVPRSIDKRDVMVWLGKNSPGVTMSYRNMDHVHTDTGSFHKVIYNAANHRAGERAVAIWKERAAQVQVAAVPAPKIAAPVQLASADPNDPLHEFAAPQQPVRPEPIVTWGDRVGIFRRYFESKDVVVRSNVTLAGVDGRLVRLVNDAATHFGRVAYVNSGYRSPSYNRRVGGARNSEHIKGRAVDFRVAGISPRELRDWIATRRDRWGIRGLGNYGSHVHADTRKATKLVSWNGGAKKRLHRYAKHRKPSRYAAAG